MEAMAAVSTTQRATIEEWLAIPEERRAELIDGKIIYQGPLIAPVEAGQVVARLRVMRGTVQALDIPLKTAESVDVGPLHRRAYDAASEYISGLFRKYVTKK